MAGTSTLIATSLPAPLVTENPAVMSFTFETTLTDSADSNKEGSDNTNAKVAFSGLLFIEPPERIG
jgi:hypothetical protein